ncbi:ABC transporter substrate-binding protein [Enterovibrio norvegicus FF-33]|uniref:ABC transporter substrate-binding protein n=1 Tax=Enterovibrio norvegicus FF-454 TaxID=1185651 RepID=A0A1E5CDV8_9GAMM|nr:ABC transporter substrate-binding protein [Enterovibrio norvegicus]OEE63352.1 ABC transporter substrate-binding protein [Enterovibrio norvegicus FF-454]OEE69990.1 ABC transporter substrate-binding protein [Enterovibrio norvegicus FF-33]OEE76181.1 ABC transporter substrate-binding protein [Enterovibrio norvegicus FF-162]
MKLRHKLNAVIAVTAIGLGVSSTAAQSAEQSLTLCWAAWDPANALVELSKDFTSETGIEMNFEFVPWTSFSSRFQNELNSRGKLCDLLIGDSQWIGGSAENGHYIKLNDFFEKEGISMSDFIPATVDAYSAWPKGSDNYWALPAMGDALGWVYRKDWFSRKDIQSQFEMEFGRELTPPKTWTELKEVSSFFQGREIDGQKVYGAAIYTERGSEGITMGATSALYAHGFQYQNPNKPYDLEGFVNSPEAAEGLKAYKELYDCCTPPGHSNAYMVANLDAYKSGQVAMQMNWFAFFPGIVKDPNVGGENSGFFLNPKQTTEGSTLGGQGISVVSYSDKKDLALQYIKWFAQPQVQSDWWTLGGYSAHRAVVEHPDFASTAPFAADFVEAMSNVKDFWQEPNYAELLQAMQKRLHDYVVAGKGTPEQALEKLKDDWQEILEDGGQL